MSVQHGMDVGAAREVARQLLELGRRADAAYDTGSGLMKVLEGVWEGPDLGTFQRGWQSTAPQVAGAAEALRRAGEALHGHADEQVEASGGEGTGRDGGWQLPDLGLPDFDFPDLNPFDDFGWDLPDIDWPDIDWGGVWDGFLDILEDIGDWWDELPWWGQLIIGVVAVVVGVVIAIVAGLEVLAVLGTILVVVGVIMIVLDLLDTIAEILRDPKAWWDKVKNMSPLELLDELVWFAVGFIPLGIGKLLQRFRKPLKELVERLSPTLRRKLDELVDWGRRKWDEASSAARRKYDELMDKLTSRRNKQDLDGGLDKHEGPNKGDGHTIRKHVGQSDEDLIDRATPKKGHTPPKDGVSTYPDQARAERAIADSIRANDDEIQRWLADPSSDRLPISHRHDYPTGRHVPAGGSQVSEVSGSRTILVKDPSMPKGYRILTSHPTP